MAPTQDYELYPSGSPGKTEGDADFLETEGQDLLDDEDFEDEED